MKMNILMKFKKPSVVTLILANLFPLFGVLVLGWKLFPIIFLYWLESAIVGFFNVKKMKIAQGQTKVNILSVSDETMAALNRHAMSAFFILHYGLFMFVHGVFVFAFFGPPNMAFWEIIGAFIFLFISHYVSYIYNFIKECEYKQLSSSQLFMQPYSRIIIMHITILAGGFILQRFGSPPGALVIMVVLKTAIDLAAHIKQHNLAQR